MYIWQNSSQIQSQHYRCGYCGRDAAPSQMYFADSVLPNVRVYIYVCPACTKPTFIDRDGRQTPPVRLGNDVGGISQEDVAALYKEARDCTSVGSYTAAVMVCRKILMNLAVQYGASAGKTFEYYVDYLSDKGFVPPQGKQWVDAIRKRGNDANHEIALRVEQDADIVLHFTEALLRFNFELPSKLQERAQSDANTG